MSLKFLVVISIQVCSISFASAQSPLPHTPILDKAAINLRLQQLRIDAFKPMQNLSANNNNVAVISYATAKFIGRNKLYDIYELPLDNMSCIIPNKFSLDPSDAIAKAFAKKDGLETNSRMPNVLKKQELIFSKK